MALVELLKLIRDLFSLWNKARREGWVSDAITTIEKIKAAQTDEERRRLARELANLGNFPP